LESDRSPFLQKIYKFDNLRVNKWCGKLSSKALSGWRSPDIWLIQRWPLGKKFRNPKDQMYKSLYIIPRELFKTQVQRKLTAFAVKTVRERNLQQAFIFVTRILISWKDFSQTSYFKRESKGEISANWAGVKKGGLFHCFYYSTVRYNCLIFSALGKNNQTHVRM